MPESLFAGTIYLTTPTVVKGVWKVTEAQTGNKQPKDEDLRFQVDAGLLFQLGEQLVARRSIALAELIKNAYDADATAVTVLLEDVTSPHGSIIIEDNGTGMTFEQIKDHWMRIATDVKVRNPTSPVFGRPYTGAKGVGRFAARRLANKLVLHSVAQRDEGFKEQVDIEFDWKKKFKSGKTLTEILLSPERRVVSDDTPTGVMLYLEDARDVWTESDIVELQRDLFTLVSPFPQDTARPITAETAHKQDPGFSYTLEVPEFPEYGGELGDKFLSAAWGVLSGRVDDQGLPHYRLGVRTSQEQIEFGPAEEVFDDLIGMRFTVHFFVYRKEFFDDLPFGVREAREMGRDQGGVRVYLDGFRVFPYGDRGDDWLRLDEVRAGRTRRLVEPTARLREIEKRIPGRPLLRTPGNNQLFGAVAVSRQEHPNVEINVSRERLVENQALAQLRRLVQLGIYWMTLQYARVSTEEEAKKREAEPEAPRPSVSDVIEQVQAEVRASEELAVDSKSALLHILDYAKEMAQVEKEEYIDELSMLRVLSATGTTVAVINHQLRAVVDGIRAIQTDLADLRPYVRPAVHGAYDVILDEMRIWREMVTRQVSQLGFLLGTSTRKRRRRLALREVVKNATMPLSLYMNDYGVEFENQVPANFRTPPIFEAELHAVLLHVLTNALKAVQTRQVRQIAAKAERGEDGVHIFMLDTGSGIEPERREEVFKPFVSSSTPDPILGVGTGLGLKIVRDILANYDGSARFIDADRFVDEVPWRTCMEIILPERRQA